MKKHKEEFVEETEEQKLSRWDRQKKMARGMARSCGIDLGKIRRERERIRREKEACSADY